MKIGDLVVVWNDVPATPKRLRRFEGMATYSDGSMVYLAGPLEPGFEGSPGCHFDHAEPWPQKGGEI